MRELLILLLASLLFACKKEIPVAEDCPGNNQQICTENYYDENNEYIGYIRFYYNSGRIEGKKIVSLQNNITRLISYYYDNENRFIKSVSLKNESISDSMVVSYFGDTLIKQKFYYHGTLLYWYDEKLNSQNQISEKRKMTAGGLYDSCYFYSYYSDGKLAKEIRRDKNLNETFIRYEYYSNVDRIYTVDSKNNLVSYTYFLKDTNGNISEIRHYDNKDKLIEYEKMIYDNQQQMIRQNFYKRDNYLYKYIIYQY